MNERIKQLAKQSGGEFWQRLENDVVNPEAYITFDPPESLDKFVELIVQECADFIGRWERFQIEQEFHHGGIRCGGGKELKRHFGVEE